MAKERNDKIQKERPPQAFLTRLIFMPLKVSIKLIKSGLAAIWFILCAFIGFVTVL